MADQVYITKLAKFLPNEPVSNDGMENILGRIDGQPSKIRNLVLKSNGIRTRYYAIDDQGRFTHTNAELTASAIRSLLDSSMRISDVELLCCGTSIPDQILPSHASMVQGCLDAPPFEIISTAGACCSGIHALKYGMLSIAGGNSFNAVCAASELVSPLLLSRHYENELAGLRRLKRRPIIAFEKDFLRWMLSDGAGAVLLESRPNPPDSLSLRIDSIDTCSFAGEVATCMYAGSSRNGGGKLVSWKNHSPEEWLENSTFAIKQDVKLLDKHIVKLGTEKLAETLRKRGVNPRDIAFLLPHISSEHFRKPLDREMKDQGIQIPQERWFTNLSTVGNIGSASIYLMMEELFYSGRLDRGMKILALVPESSRFSYAFVLMTVC